MVRGEAYRVFVVPNYQAMVFVCDEEANATFIAFTSEPEDWESFGNFRKSELKNRPDVRMLAYRDNAEQWKIRIRHALSEGPINRSLESPTEERQKDIPEGWLAAREVAEQLGRSYMWITQTASQHQAEHPEWFGKFTNRSREFYAPELVALLREKDAEYSEAPEGWLVATSISESFGQHRSTILRTAERYRTVHPEWFGVFKDQWNRPREHYSPDLVALIQKETESFELVPEGWQTGQGLATEFGRSGVWIRQFANQQRKDHPDWFRMYRDQQGKTNEFYAPQLAAEIREAVLTLTSPPVGWQGSQEIADNLDRAYLWVTRRVEQYRAEHPEWFGIYLDRSKRPREYYAPELITLLNQENEKVTPPPEGWLTANAVAEQLGRSGTWVIQAAERARLDHPDWFRTHLDVIGNLREHYAPSLIEFIKAENQSYMSAPTGWRMAWDLQRELGRSYQWVTEQTQQYRTSRPEWFGRYADQQNKLQEFYSPELVDLIYERAKRYKAAPAGWQPSPAVADLVNRRPGTVRTLANKYRSEHPEWFGMYLNHRQQVVEYYAPALISALQTEVGRYVAPPEGWLLTMTLVQETGRSHNWLAKIADQYRSGHPEWFVVFLDSFNRPREHYAPELVAILRQRAKTEGFGPLRD